MGMMAINGIAHIILTVRGMERSGAFYKPLLELMGLQRIKDKP